MLDMYLLQTFTLSEEKFYLIPTFPGLEYSSGHRSAYCFLLKKHSGL